MVDRERKGITRAKSKSASLQSDNVSHHHQERDDIDRATPQSTTETTQNISAAESPHVTSASLDPTLVPGGDPQQPGFISQLSGYLLSPGGPLIADWDNTLSLSTFGTFFEPQGELATAFSPQPNPLQQDFAFPIPVCRASTVSLQSSTPAVSSPALASSRRGSAGPTTDYAVTADMATPRAGMKRKAGSDTSVLLSAGDAGTSYIKRPAPGRHDSSSRTMTMQLPSSTTTPSIAGAERQSTQPPEPQESRTGGPLEPSRTEESSTKTSSRRIADITPRLSPILPAGKVFPIRIGSELFQLSGASLSSDAPSYFSHYFGEQLLQSGGRASTIKTLYIDRDPETFRDIALHLQGYHIKPRDGAHYVRLFADAQFYSLPRLTQQLFKSEIFIQVGERHFQVPRSLFSAPGDLPNFFTLGFAHFFSTSNETFPGVDGQTLLRPPSILPPAVPNRNGDIFADLLCILQGYDVNIRDEAHRKELLRDARYFHLKGVEQKLLPCEISYNLSRQRSEIVICLEDLRQSGITFVPDGSPFSSPPPQGGGKADNNTTSASVAAGSSGAAGSAAAGATTGAGAGTGAGTGAGAGPSTNTTSKPGTPHSMHAYVDPSGSPAGWISYQRPFVDEQAHELVVEIVGLHESTRLDPSTRRATFTGDVRARIASLFSVVASKMGLPATLPLGLMMVQSGGGVAVQPVSPANSGISGDQVRVRIGKEASVELNGKELEWESEEEERDDDESDDDEDDKDEDSDDDDEDRRDPNEWPKIKSSSGVGPDIHRKYWIVTRALWRLRVERSRDTGRTEVVMCVVKLEAHTTERSRNKKREFLEGH